MKSRFIVGQFSAAVPRRAALALGFVTWTMMLGVSAGAQDEAAIITFDPPGSISTYAQSSNPSGEIVGDYLDASYLFHGYLRARNGTIKTFDAPGGGTNSIIGISLNITPAEKIVGAYFDANTVYHGFIRARDGAVTTFDVPGAGTDSGHGTFPSAPEGVSPAGTIVGSYTDDAGVTHGFVRARDGSISPIDVQGAGTGSGQGTSAQNISAVGVVTGWYLDASDVYHGFVRDRNGDTTRRTAR